MRVPTRSLIWVRTLFAYGVAQLVIALGGFVRIPLIVDQVGVEAYGILIAAGGLCVGVIAIADGFTQAARIQAIDVGIAAYVPLQRQAKSISLLSAGILGLLWVLAQMVGNEWFVVCSAALFGATAAIVGGVSRGFLEARGRTALSNLLQTSTTLVGVPLLAGVLLAQHSLVAAGFVTGLGLALPQLFGWVVWRVRFARSAMVGKVKMGFAPFRELMAGEPARSIRHMVQWTWANAASYALDAAILAAAVGAVSAAEFGIASRIMTLAMLLTLGLNPLITSQVAIWRGDAPSLLMGRCVRLSLVLAGGAGLLSAVTLALAAPLTMVLSHGEVVSSQSLLAWLAAFAVLSAATAPLAALYAGVGGSGYRRTASLVGVSANLAVTIACSIAFGTVGPAIGSVTGLLVLTALLLIGLRSRRGSLLTTHGLGNDAPADSI